MKDWPQSSWNTSCISSCFGMSFVTLSGTCLNDVLECYLIYVHCSNYTMDLSKLRQKHRYQRNWKSNLFSEACSLKVALVQPSLQAGMLSLWLLTYYEKKHYNGETLEDIFNSVSFLMYLFPKEQTVPAIVLSGPITELAPQMYELFCFCPRHNTSVIHRLPCVYMLSHCHGKNRNGMWDFLRILIFLWYIIWSST